MSGPKKVDSSLVRFFKILSCWYISKSYTFFKREQIPNPQRSFEIVPLFFWKDSTSIGFYILLTEDCCMHMKVDWKRKNSAKKEHQILYLILFIILSSCLEDKSSFKKSKNFDFIPKPCTFFSIFNLLLATSEPGTKTIVLSENRTKRKLC